MSSIVNLVSGTKSDNSVEAHFMSESGVIDMFILMGPKPKDAIRQYASLTGVAPLPQVNSHHKTAESYNTYHYYSSINLLYCRTEGK